MREDLLTSLNPKQRQAVELGSVHALILAGAGSGKTKVLTTRIAWLLSNGLAYPSQILAVTFTNKAAREMRTRLEAMVSHDISNLWMGTFHGIAHRLLRLHAQEAGLPKTFQIIDSSDQLSLIKRIMKEAGIDPDRIDPKAVQAMINRYKESGLRSSDVQTDRNDQTGQTLYQVYEARCQKEGLVDFAELLLRSLELLEHNALLREHYAERFRYVLVDEFQDTNELQYRWIRALSNPAKQQARVFCVGDDDQSIYAFRGARVGNMAAFVQDYGVREVIRLEQNYRSTSHILDAANAVIANNPERMGKNLWTDRGAGEPISLYFAESDRKEALMITQEIMTLHRTGAAYRDCAILYRNNSQSRVIEQYFIANSIPYRIYGGLRFFDRAEVKDITAYLRVMSNPDDTSLLRVVNHPPRGIGATTMQRVGEMAQQMGKSLWEVMTTCQAETSVKRTKGFVELIERMKTHCAGMNLADTVNEIIELSGLKAHYAAQRDHDIRLENLSEVVNAAKGYYEENDLDEDADAFAVVPGGEMTPVDGFLSQAALEADDKNDNAESLDQVQLMTVHASKGLEFDTVFLTGLEEGLFPHAARDGEDANKAISEERRLMYVAMTRAKKRLRISYCATRMMYGRTNFNERSSFIDEIPAEHIVEVNAPKPVAAPSNAWSSGARSASSFAGAGTYKKPPTGAGARNVDSSAWKSAGVRRASDFAGAVRSKQANEEVFGFRVGQAVHHPKFGAGTITGILYPDKPDQALFNMRFASGAKQLIAHIAKDILQKS